MLYVYADIDDDLPDVMDAVKSVAADWSKFALRLRLRSSDTATIGKDKHGDSEECLQAALTLWLKENYNTARFGHPSWRTLVAAVKDMDKALAIRIANAHRI